jgi:hypothetical protein
MFRQAIYKPASDLALVMKKAIWILIHTTAIRVLVV